MSDSAVPTVSVVLRTYNHARFIAQAIESVLIQRAPFRIELVIAEDCSDDGTRQIVEGYAQSHPSVIRPLLPERNLGHGEILRRGLAAARGKYVAYLDGDDYWTSRTKLAQQVELLEASPECASCFHDVSLVYDEAGLPSGAISPSLGEDRFTLEQIVMECFVPAPSMVFRREVVASLPDWAFASAWIDWLIHIRCAQLGPLAYLGQPLAAYRVHRGGMFSGMDRTSQLEEDLHFYQRLKPELPEKAALIDRCVAFRRAQLAIEQLGVPFDACVVLVDPRRELRPYFNGRHARNLPRREGHEVTELQAIREAAATLPLAARDYGPPAGAESGTRACYAVVPRTAMEWLDAHSRLRAYLDAQGELAWRDEWVVVYELEPPESSDDRASSRGARRVEVAMLQPADGLVGGHLDAPASGALLPAHAVSVVGWAVGGDLRVAAIEFEVGGEVTWRAPVQIERRDVGEAFPDLTVGSPGFGTTLNVQDLPADATVDVFAVFADGTRARFAELRIRERDDGVGAPR